MPVPRKYDYRRKLPHLQKDNRAVFVTFNTYKRWTIPEHARNLVMQHCLHDNGAKMRIHALVVMPDHLHMAFTPMDDDKGGPYSIVEIMQPIKSASAHTLNQRLGRKGRVWQAESFDHVVRCSENLSEKIDYICQNPVRKGLVKRKEEYP